MNQQGNERWIIGQVVTTETTVRTYDVYSDDWDFAYWDEEPNDEDIGPIVASRQERMITDGFEWEWELTAPRCDPQGSNDE